MSSFHSKLLNVDRSVVDVFNTNTTISLVIVLAPLILNGIQMEVAMNVDRVLRSASFGMILAERTSIHWNVGEEQAEFWEHSPCGDLVEVVEDLRIGTFIVVADDESLVAVETLEVALTALAEVHVTKMVDLVLRLDDAVPVLNHRLVHLGEIRERPVTEFDDIFMAPVSITDYPDVSFGHWFPLLCMKDQANDNADYHAECEMSHFTSPCCIGKNDTTISL